MAIIYTYPEINQVEGGDLLLISDTSLHKRPTRSVTVNDLAAYIGIGFWKLGTAPDSIFTTKMTSVGQDANIANSKFNVYKTEDMVTSVPHVATFNESSSNHSANLWPSPGDNSADIYGSVSRATFTGSGTVDQIIGSNPIGRHSGSGNVNFIQGAQTTASLTGSGSTDAIIASYNKTFIEGTGSNNISTAIGSWNVAELNGLNDVDNIYGTYSNVVLTRGDVNDDAIGHFIDFDQVSADTEVNNAYYIHAKNDSLSVTGEKFFIKDETGIPSQFSNKLVLNAYGSGTFTGTATQRLAVDTSGNVIEIPIGSGPVDGSGTANYTARWIDTDTLGIGALYDNGTNVGIGTTNPVNKLHVHNGITRLDSGSASSNALGVYSNFSTTAINLFTGSTGSGFISVNNNGMNLGAPWNGGVKVSILNGGNVGIGTTSPGSTLPTDSETASKVLQLTGAGGSTGDTAVLLRSLDNSSGLDLWHNVSSGDSYIDNRYNSNQGDTIFRVKTAGTPLEALRITGNGNVGIGTTSPSNPLTVIGADSIGIDDYILHNDDGNTKFGFPSNDTFKVRTAGSDRFYINSSGDVGIGTTSPSQKLEVAGNVKLDGDNRHIFFGGNNTFIGERSNSTELELRGGGNITAHTVYIDNTGQIGIGTNVPSSKLHAVGDIRQQGSSYSVNITEGTSINGDNHLDIAANGSYLNLRSPNNSIFYRASSDHAFRDANGSNEYLRIKTSGTTAGNVGIGTTSPASKLDVAGTGSFTGQVTIPATPVASTDAASKSYVDAHGGGLGPFLPLTGGTLSGNLTITKSSATMKVSEAGGGDIRMVAGGATGYMGTYNNTSMQIMQNGSNAIFIDTSKNVGIGTTSPAYPLDIQSSSTVALRLNNSSNSSCIIKTDNSYLSLESAGYVLSSNPILAYEGVWLLNNKFIRSKESDGTWTDLLGLDSSNVLKVGTLGNVSSGGDVAFLVSGSEKMRVASNGKVGIGTTSPTKDLEIGTHAAAETEFRMHSDESGRYFNIQSAGNFTSVKTTGSQNFILDSSGSSGYVTFVTNASERMRVNYNGNVGIGTTSPLSKLNVNGDIKIEGENELYFGSSGSVPLWEIKASGSDLVINNTATNVGSVLFNNDEGIVLPRLTTTEINAISLPNTGLTVYNTTLNTLCFYNGISWQKVSHTNM